MAADLRRRPGCARGRARIGLAAEPGRGACCVFLACSRNGYVCNPSLHQNYTVAEIVLLLERIQCEALFGQTGYGADANRAGVAEQIGAVGSLRRSYWLDARRAAGERSGDFPAADGKKPDCAPDANPDKIVYLAFTSGTTGLPKARHALATTRCWPTAARWSRTGATTPTPSC